MARARGTAALASTGATATAATERLRIPTNGPHDAEALDAKFTPPKGTVDFGAVRVPVPAEGSVVVEPASAGRMQAVHVSVPEGRLSVSALAAPRNGGLWPDLAGEIDTSLREGGARVRSFTGEWGRELHATTDGATSVFVGVDGPRWMLYGVATGPTRDAVALDARLRRMLRGTVVVRGKAPYPVRTVLPLTPQSTGAGVEQTGAAPPTMTLRTSLAGDVGTNGAAAQVSEPVNGTSTAGAPLLAGLRGPETSGPTQVASTGILTPPPGTNGHPAAANGSMPGGATVAGTGGVPVAAAPVNGWAPTGGHPADATPSLGAPVLGGATPYSAGPGAYGVPPGDPATNGTGTYGVPTNGTGAYAAPPVGPPTGAYAFGPGGYGTPQPGPATNGATPYGAPPAGSATGATPYGVPPAGSATGANAYGVPAAGSATNAMASYGGPPVGSPTGATPYDVPQPGVAANGTSNGAAPQAGPPTGGLSAYGTGSYGTSQPAPATNGSSTYGAGPYGTGTYGVPTGGTAAHGVPPVDPTKGANAYSTGGYLRQPDAAVNGAATYGVPPVDSTSDGTGAYGAQAGDPATGASGYGTGGYTQQPGPTSMDAADHGYGRYPAADGARAGSASGANAYDTGSYGIPQPGPATNGTSTYGASIDDGLSFTPTNGAVSADPAPADGSTSGLELGSAPTSTGGHARPAVPPGWAHESGSRRPRSAVEPPQDAAALPQRRSEQAWAPSTPDAEHVDPTPSTASPRSSLPVEPASDWRPSWADPEPASPAASWDPLFGPLAGGLDPLPEPAATWSDVVDRPERPVEPARPDGAGTPLFDAAVRPTARTARRPAASDAGTPLFDAAARPTARTARPPAASDMGTPLFDAASRTRESTPVSGRRRREGAHEPAERTRRHREGAGDERLSALAPSRGAEEPRSGRRRAPEPAGQGRHDAGTVPSRHGVDAEARHAETGTAYVAQHGTSHRVPPTQWAWPKDPAAVGAEPEASTGRRAADTGPASWSAAELVDSPGYGGRRRRGENGRHGEPDDVEPGRHHRP